MAPVIILMAVFTFYPLLNTILISLVKDYSPMRTYSDGSHSVWGAIKDNGISLFNYKHVLGIPYMKAGGLIREEKVITYALPNTIILCFITVPLSIAIALMIAVGLNSIKVLGKFFQTIFFVPYVTNAIAVGMVFAVIFNGSNGLWNTIFGLGNVAWVGPTYDDLGNLTDPSKFNAMFALIVYIVWHALPYKILILLSGIQNIDKQYYEAAKIDSASKAKTFFRITVPLLSPQIVYILITSLIGGFKEYSSVVGLFNAPTATNRGGNYEMYTVVYYIYDNITTHPGYASAAAVLLFFIIMIFTLIQKLVLDKRTHY